MMMTTDKTQDQIAAAARDLHEKTGLPVAAFEDLLSKCDWSPDELVPPVIGGGGRRRVLSAKEVADVRARLAADKTVKPADVARDKGVSVSTLYRALSRGAAPRRTAGTAAVAASAPMHYDPGTCLSARDLRAIGARVPSEVPEEAWMSASALSVVRLPHGWAFVFAEPLRWQAGDAELSAKVGPVRFGGAA
jgi:hypothetical protein